MRKTVRTLIRNLVLGLAVGYGGTVSAGAISDGDILKFDIGPKGQKVFPGFTAVGPDTVYTAQLGYGWTSVPKYFATFPRWEAFPDALTCDLAAPSPPLSQCSARTILTER